MSQEPDIAYRVLMVCTGNICRSVMAERVFQTKLVEAEIEHLVVVDSVGTSDEEVGNPMDPRARSTLEAAGYPTGDHTARQIDAGWLADRELIIVMTADHADIVRTLIPAEDHPKVRMLRSFDEVAVRTASDDSGGLWGEGLDIADPWYGDMAGFAVALDQIESAMPGLLEFIEAELEFRDALSATS